MLAYRCSNCGAFNRVPEQRKADKPVCGRCKVALDTSGAPQSVSGDQLAQLTQESPVPVLVDFWAAWCGPCRTAAPMLDRLARQRAGKLLVVKLDTEENQAAASTHRIQSIPTFAMFHDGAEVGRQVGLPPEAAFASWVDRQLPAPGNPG